MKSEKAVQYIDHYLAVDWNIIIVYTRTALLMLHKYNFLFNELTTSMRLNKIHHRIVLISEIEIKLLMQIVIKCWNPNR